MMKAGIILTNKDLQNLVKVFSLVTKDRILWIIEHIATHQRCPDCDGLIYYDGVMGNADGEYLAFEGFVCLNKECGWKNVS